MKVLHENEGLFDNSDTENQVTYMWFKNVLKCNRDGKFKYVASTHSHESGTIVHMSGGIDLGEVMKVLDEFMRTAYP